MNRLTPALLALATAVSAPAWAQPQRPSDTALPQIEAAVRLVKDSAVVRSVRDVPNTGMKEVVADATVIYMDPQGQYLFFGTLLDMKNKKNLTELAQAGARAVTLRDIPESEKIVVKAPAEKYRVTVFTDVSCGYCKLLHQNEAAYLQRGITIEYVAFPRGGAQSDAYKTMRQIWCAKDRAKAYGAAIEGGALGESSNCADPVARHYAIGDSMAIEGTPAIFTADGRQLGGFLPPDQLEKRLKSGAPDPQTDDSLAAN